MGILFFHSVSPRSYGSSPAHWTTVGFFVRAFFLLIRIQPGILDDREISPPLRLPQYGSGTPSQTTMRVSPPIHSITIDKGRPSHVGTYGVKATQKSWTRDFHATENTSTQVQKHPKTRNISIRGPPRQGRYKGQAPQNISDKGTSEPR